MIDQKIQDVLDRIKAALASAEANASQVAGLQGQVADLTSKLNDAQAQVADLEAAIVALDPGGSTTASPPTDGSGSGDLTP
jgi:ABC-type transporter Mla subunit MlaD